MSIMFSLSGFEVRGFKGNEKKKELRISCASGKCNEKAMRKSSRENWQDLMKLVISLTHCTSESSVVAI